MVYCKYRCVGYRQIKFLILWRTAVLWFLVGVGFADFKISRASSSVLLWAILSRSQQRPSERLSVFCVSQATMTENTIKHLFFYSWLRTSIDVLMKKHVCFIWSHTNPKTESYTYRPRSYSTNDDHTKMTSSNGNFSTLLALFAGNSLVTGEFPSHRVSDAELF